MVRDDGKNYTKYDYEHKIVVENFIKRKIRKNEIIHHVNEKKDDNRIENLMVFNSKSAHVRYHFNPSNVSIDEIIFDGRTLI